jgi:hypothetical protein
VEIIRTVRKDRSKAQVWRKKGAICGSRVKSDAKFVLARGREFLENAFIETIQLFEQGIGDGFHPSLKTAGRLRADFEMEKRTGAACEKR